MRPITLFTSTERQVASFQCGSQNQPHPEFSHSGHSRNNETSLALNLDEGVERSTAFYQSHRKVSGAEKLTLTLRSAGTHGPDERTQEAQPQTEGHRPQELWVMSVLKQGCTGRDRLVVFHKENSLDRRMENTRTIPQWRVLTASGLALPGSHWQSRL